VYRFRGTLVGQLSSTSDIIAAAITLDPTGYTEFADFSALFTEIRVVSSKLTLCPFNPYCQDVVHDYSTGSAVVGLNLGNTSTAPASRPTVFSIPGAKPVMMTQAYPTVINAKIPSMAWATTAAPVPGAFAGCYGAWEVYMSGVDGAMINGVQLEYYIENVYELRGRK